MIARLFLTGILVCAVGARAEANMGKPWSGGTPAGEPVGIRGVAVVHEELVIDFRPITQSDDGVLVAATYHLENRGEATHLDLVFATGSATKDFRITIDGKPVLTTPRIRADQPDLPAAWLPPQSMPELYRDAIALDFGLDVPAGKHDVLITYVGEAVLYHAGEPALNHDFTYVLAPARTWEQFGGLDVMVHVPPDWDASVQPALTRHGDTLQGSFPSLPADLVVISVHAPTGWYGAIRTALLILLVLVLLGGPVAIVRHTRASEQKRDGWPSGWAAAARGLSWSFAILVVGVLALTIPDLAIAHDQADHRGYGVVLAIVGIMFLAVLALIIGSITSRIVGHGVHKRRLATVRHTAP